MTADEIIKTLEMCMNDKKCFENNCPFIDSEDCVAEVNTATIKLLRELQEENKQLKEDINEFEEAEPINYIIGSREDLIQNLKEANTHLLICLEDIKYPLEEREQELLKGAEFASRIILDKLIKEDIAEVLRILGKQQKCQ